MIVIRLAVAPISLNETIAGGLAFLGRADLCQISNPSAMGAPGNQGGVNHDEFKEVKDKIEELQKELAQVEAKRCRLHVKVRDKFADAEHRMTDMEKATATLRKDMDNWEMDAFGQKVVNMEAQIKNLQRMAKKPNAKEPAPNKSSVKQGGGTGKDRVIEEDDSGEDSTPVKGKKRAAKGGEPVAKRSKGPVKANKSVKQPAAEVDEGDDFDF